MAAKKMIDVDEMQEIRDNNPTDPIAAEEEENLKAIGVEEVNKQPSDLKESKEEIGVADPDDMINMKKG